MSPKLSPPSIGDVMAGQGNAVDSRYHLSAATRRQLNKVFPTHWSFLLGEIAMYSFIVLLLTGVYLTLFFDPSMQRRRPTTVSISRCAAWKCRRRTRQRSTSASRCAAACSSARSTTGPR